MLLRTILLVLTTTGSAALADDMKKPVNAKDLKWGPAPDVLPKGAQVTVLSGNFHIGMGDKSTKGKQCN